MRKKVLTKRKQEAHQLVGRQNAAALEFDPNPSEAAFSTVVSDVISGMVDQDVCANFCDSGLKLSVAVTGGWGYSMTVKY